MSPPRCLGVKAWDKEALQRDRRRPSLGALPSPRGEPWPFLCGRGTGHSRVPASQEELRLLKAGGGARERGVTLREVPRGHRRDPPCPGVEGDGLRAQQTPGGVAVAGHLLTTRSSLCARHSPGLGLDRARSQATGGGAAGLGSAST